jgi:hypothetical protein
MFPFILSAPFLFHCHAVALFDFVFDTLLVDCNPDRSRLSIVNAPVLPCIVRNSRELNRFVL